MNANTFTGALLEKAKKAKSVEELLALAKENGMKSFTRKNAEQFFEQLHKSDELLELTDDDMEQCSGGYVPFGEVMCTRSKGDHL